MTESLTQLPTPKTSEAVQHQSYIEAISRRLPPDLGARFCMVADSCTELCTAGVTAIQNTRQ